MEDFVTVATYLSLAEAEPPRLALEAEGIPAMATDESMGSLLGTSTVMGIKLQVAAKDAERAAEVLASFAPQSRPKTDEADDSDEDEDEDEDDDSDDGVSLKCPACGAAIWYPSESRGNAEVCPECGAHVDVPAINTASPPGP